MWYLQNLWDVLATSFHGLNTGGFQSPRYDIAPPGCKMPEAEWRWWGPEPPLLLTKAPLPWPHDTLAASSALEAMMSCIPVEVSHYGKPKVLCSSLVTVTLDISHMFLPLWTHPISADSLYSEPSSECSHHRHLTKPWLTPRTQFSLQTSEVFIASPSHFSCHWAWRWRLSSLLLTAILKPLSLSPPQHAGLQSSCLRMSLQGSPPCFSYPQTSVDSSFLQDLVLSSLIILLS